MAQRETNGWKWQFLGEQIVKYCKDRWTLTPVSGRKVCTVGYKVKNCKDVKAKVVLFRLLVGVYVGRDKD